VLKFERFTFLTAHRIFLCGNESPMDESGGIILLGDNTGGGVVMLPSITFHCVGVWI